MNGPTLLALIAKAVQARASDISFEPEDDGALQIIVRVDGIRQRLERIPESQSAIVIARLKTMAGLPSYIRDEAQDGRIGGAEVGGMDLRLSILPTVRGERCSLRLPAIGVLPPPSGLGFPPPATAALQRIMRRPDGLMLLAGPTGSGKTTTLHSLIHELIDSRDDRHVVTIEDPVERRIAGATQIETAPHRGFGFVEGLTAALRHDPDVIVVGEVRDPPTAMACVRAALTGHLVLSTIHAGRARDVVPRLLEMGIEPGLLMPALVATAAQRLVRRRHQACRGEGCQQCIHGWTGRQAIIDVLLMDQENRDRIRQHLPAVLTTDLDAQAVELIAAGDTSSEEVARVVG